MDLKIFEQHNEDLRLAEEDRKEKLANERHEAAQKHDEKLAKIAEDGKTERESLAIQDRKEQRENTEAKKNKKELDKTYNEVCKMGTARKIWHTLLVNALKSFLGLHKWENKKKNKPEEGKPIFDDGAENKFFRLIFLILPPLCFWANLALFNSLFTLIAEYNSSVTAHDLRHIQWIIPLFLTLSEIVLGKLKENLKGLLRYLANNYALILGLTATISHVFMNVTDFSSLLEDPAIMLVGAGIFLLAYLLHSVILEFGELVVRSYGWLYFGLCRLQVIIADSIARGAWGGVFRKVQKWADLHGDEEPRMETLPLFIREILDWYSNDKDNLKLMAKIKLVNQAPSHSGDGATGEQDISINTK